MTWLRTVSCPTMVITFTAAGFCSRLYRDGRSYVYRLAMYDVAAKALVLELTTLDDRLLIAVIDPGSQLEPQMLAANPAAPHGFGLRLVDEMSSAWGVIRDAAGTTRVWCELSLDRAQPC